MSGLALCLSMSMLLGQAPESAAAAEPPSRYTQAEAQSLFNEGNEAYSRHEYATAQARYEQLVKAGMGGPTVLYNLGTTHLAAGQLGPAVLYLERALRLSRDEDIEANLAVARQKQGDQVVGAEAVSEPFLQRLAAAIDVQLVGILFLVCWYLAFGFVVMTWQRTASRWVFGAIAAVLLLISAVLGGSVAAHAYVTQTVIEAVVQPETVKVYEFPGERAKVSFEAHAGLKVRIMEETGRFVRIRLPNALEGWTDKEGLVEL